MLHEKWRGDWRVKERKNEESRRAREDANIEQARKKESVGVMA